MLNNCRGTITSMIGFHCAAQPFTNPESPSRDSETITGRLSSVSSDIISQGYLNFYVPNRKNLGVFQLFREKGDLHMRILALHTTQIMPLSLALISRVRISEA